MFNFTINSPEDWYNIQRTIIKQWKIEHSMFSHDIKKLEHTIDLYITEYSKKMVLYRQTHSKSCLDSALKELQTASEILKTFSKREMLATLSKG